MYKKVRSIGSIGKNSKTLFSKHAHLQVKFAIYVFRTLPPLEGCHIIEIRSIGILRQA